MECVDNMSKLHINNVLDELQLYLLDLMQQYIQCKINIERLANAGQLLLAKTRYVQGTQSVSIAQLPTENSPEFKALCRVEQINDNDDNETIFGSKLQLIRSNVEKSNGYADPLHWFTVLAPGTLRNAANQYKNVIELLIENANIQREMSAVMNHINQLNILKASS